MSVSLVGDLALWVALVLTAWGATVSGVAGPLGREDLARSGARAAHAATLFVGLALLALWSALLRTDLGLAYVAGRGGIAATPVERVVALWSAPGGALLTLATVVGLVTSVAFARELRLGGGPSGTARWTLLSAGVASAHVLLLGVILTALIAAPPFAATTWALADGQGLPPAWRHIAMLVLWPLWSLALAAAAAASALGMAAAPGRSPRTLALWHAAADWIRAAWLLATAALLAALWWSYRTMPALDGWMARAIGPGALVAWVTLSAASSGMLLARLRGVRGRLLAFTAPIVALMAASFGAAESGWDPLHALAHEADGAWWIVAIAAIALLIVHAVVRVGGSLPAPASEDHAGRGDAAFLLGRRLAVVGASLLALGLLGGAFRRSAELELTPGQPAALTDVFGREWRVVYQGMSVRESRTSFGAPRAHEVLYPFAIDRGDAGTIVISRVREVVDVLGRPTAPPWPYPGIRHGALQDVIALPDSVGRAETVHVRIAFVPLPALIWLGGITLLVGGLLAAQARRGSRA